MRPMKKVGKEKIGNKEMPEEKKKEKSFPFSKQLNW